MGLLVAILLGFLILNLIPSAIGLFLATLLVKRLKWKLLLASFVASGLPFITGLLIIGSNYGNLELALAPMIIIEIIYVISYYFILYIDQESGN